MLQGIVAIGPSPNSSMNAGASERQGHDKTAASALHHFAAGLTAMAACDSPYQRQAQFGSSRLAGACRAIERPEDVLKFRRGYAGTIVPDGDDRRLGAARGFHVGGRGAMAARV